MDNQALTAPSSGLSIGSANVTHASLEKLDNGFVVRFYDPKSGPKNLICNTLADVNTELTKAFQL